MARIDAGQEDYQHYQDFFVTRKVGAVNDGVPDYKDEMKELADDIDRVPWNNLTDEEKVAVANTALDAAQIISRISIQRGEIQTKVGFATVNKIGGRLFNALTDTEDPFKEMGLFPFGKLRDEFGD